MCETAMVCILIMYIMSVTLGSKLGRKVDFGVERWWLVDVCVIQFVVVQFVAPETGLNFYINIKTPQ